MNQIPGITKDSDKEKIKKCTLPPNFNDYNIINNQPLSEDYFKAVNLKLPLKEKKTAFVSMAKRRDFNIVTNKYLEKDEER